MVKTVSDHQSLLSPSSLSSSKRKQLEEDEPSPTTTKKQRTRVSFSCGECHRRKQKCDRQIPCSHCISRKVPELCKAYTPGKTDQDLGARIARLEHIIEMALPQFCNSESTSSGQYARSSSVTEDDARSQHEDQEASGGIFQSGKWYGNSASGSIAPGSVLEQLQNAVTLSSSVDKSSSVTSTANGSTNVIDSVATVLEPSAADNLKTLVQECGVSPHKIPELLQELPPRRTSDVLINYYFSEINWTRYAISEKDFRVAYTSVCDHGAHGIGATNPNDVRFLPLLFVVLAISVRLAPEEMAGDARHRRVTSLRYYWSSRRSLLIAAAIQPDSLDIVLTRLLSARFLTFDRRITECWSQLGAAVRTAEALGLHRDGATMGMEPGLVEYRRRIWSYLYHADRSYALVLGRPHSIQDDYTSTLPPTNMDDESPPSRTALPLTAPTRMTHIILRHQLASIIGRIVHHFQKVRTASHYSEVVTLDDELLKFVSNLPPHYSIDPDISLDEKHPFIPVHRYLLITEILFVRTSLHRPYILRRLSSDRYARSRAACFESAIKDFQVRHAFREKAGVEKHTSLSNAYREFQTAMISGIYLVIEPNGADAETMHTILDRFLKDHEGMREMDETTRREIKIIEFLKNKSLERSRLPEPPPIVTNGDSAEIPNRNTAAAQDQRNNSPVPSSSKTPFPSIFTLPTSSPHEQASYNYHNPAPLNHSPTFQRLQQQPHGEYSPTTSSSPAAEDESTAQIMFDHWCNTVSNAPMDGPTPGAVSWGGPGGADLSGWAGTQPMMPTMNGADPRLLSGLDSTDWNYYWEALVNQIPRGT
ncbi:hypothetical protein K435DRAFT_708323 [Dendrothele bispora CBS 962.96]|uniref:Zn(2)-C6 fungal-type domain-containing protein n=1 Tax=Dendrothele bispora (strain CBS 962.96) TaxID=1314807 RepID=A0A4V4HIZ2_DENBC|nr:hypothetical protein K435DRAFT_708323 [Dendrothele bispora CBS 962.96]